ncbi:MAG: PKD domain-containing protein [Candidatus Peribacteria bacterium]|jgi:surface protein|nr:PKD domain-containing protein [Candidatus Peribacteria bacterium]
MKKLPLLSLIGVALIALSFIALKSNPEVEVTLHGDVLAVVEETVDTSDSSNLDTEESSSEDGKIDIEQDIDETDKQSLPPSGTSVQQTETKPDRDENLEEGKTSESQFPSLTGGEGDPTSVGSEEGVETEEDAIENAEPMEAESLVDTTAFDASTDIQLTAVISEAGQTVTLNKYFANVFSVDWGDGTTGDVTTGITHIYTAPDTYPITLTKITPRWTFTGENIPLIPTTGTTSSNVYVSSMPPMSLFGDSETSVGDYFFQAFNRDGSLTSLPVGSFDTSNITTVGGYFFHGFNRNGSLTSLPVGSFDTSNITTVGDSFFY